MESRHPFQMLQASVGDLGLTGRTKQPPEKKSSPSRSRHPFGLMAVPPWIQSPAESTAQSDITHPPDSLMLLDHTPAPPQLLQFTPTAIPMRLSMTILACADCIGTARERRGLGLVQGIDEQDHECEPCRKPTG